MYGCEIRKSVEKLFCKLAKKDKKTLIAIERKVQEILENPHHCKNLKYPLQHLKRVHIEGSFVLVFSVDESRKIVIIEDFGHHDEIYRIK